MPPQSYSLEAAACALLICLLLSLDLRVTGAPLFDPRAVCTQGDATLARPPADSFAEQFTLALQVNGNRSHDDGESVLLPVNAKGISQVEIRGRGFTRAVAGEMTCFTIVGESTNPRLML